MSKRKTISKLNCPGKRKPEPTKCRKPKPEVPKHPTHDAIDAALYAYFGALRALGRDKVQLCMAAFALGLPMDDVRAAGVRIGVKLSTPEE